MNYDQLSRIANGGDINHEHYNTARFAVACVEQNSIDELEIDTNTVPDKFDCREWDLTEAQWRIAINAARQELIDEKFSQQQ